MTTIHSNAIYLALPRVSEGLRTSSFTSVVDWLQLAHVSLMEKNVRSAWSNLPPCRLMKSVVNGS